MNPALILLRNLLLTVLIEGALVLVFIKRKSTAFHSVLVNMLTNPIVNILLVLWGSFYLPYYYLAFTFLEVFAVITEAVLYEKMGDFGIKKAFFASILLNAASCSFGFFL